MDGPQGQRAECESQSQKATHRAILPAPVPSGAWAGERPLAFGGDGAAFGGDGAAFGKTGKTLETGAGDGRTTA